MNKLNVYMTTQGDPEPPRDNDDDDSSPTYKEVHEDGDSGYGNMKD